MTVVFISGPIHICLYCICYKRPMRKHATLSLSLSLPNAAIISWPLIVSMYLLSQTSPSPSLFGDRK